MVIANPTVARKLKLKLITISNQYGILHPHEAHDERHAAADSYGCQNRLDTAPDSRNQMTCKQVTQWIRQRQSWNENHDTTNDDGVGVETWIYFLQQNCECRQHKWGEHFRNESDVRVLFYKMVRQKANHANHRSKRQV